MGFLVTVNGSMLLIWPIVILRDEDAKIKRKLKGYIY